MKEYIVRWGVLIYLVVMTTMILSGFWNLVKVTEPIVRISIALTTIIPGILGLILFNCLSIHGYMSNSHMEKNKKSLEDNLSNEIRILLKKRGEEIHSAVYNKEEKEKRERE
jgi:hypothetical protein